MIRQTERLFKTLSQLMLLSEASLDNLDILEETVGVVQHHDAVTGTEKQHVVIHFKSTFK